MKGNLFFYCGIIFCLFLSGCAVKQHAETPGPGATDSALIYDPYALDPSDTSYYEFDESSFVVTPDEYRPSFTIINNLVHTKLDVAFDWEKAQLKGKAWITLSPHFYPTDSLTLDAKGMDIHKLELVRKSGNVGLSYVYDTLQLRIKLDKSYSRKETYTVYVEYTAKPNELKVNGSEAINDARGLYFINHDGKESGKPRQLWTQGETESNSAWFPTIDKPNLKMTTELSMTVEKGYATLSNGIMISSKNNADGTHTDTWKMDLPYAPYLVMMAAGPFSIVKDKWKNMEVSYYVDPEYAPYARDIFGDTPEMLEFFSNRLGVPYPWPKYSQVVVHDFVTGAMENVTASVFYERMHMTSRELIDERKEDIIAHELFHQWFGDLVTCESWANIAMNESFATYGEYLWNEYKHGKDRADAGLHDDLTQYLYISNISPEPLARFNYKNRDDVFDAISYQKGGRVLHLLRHYVGDEAFFQSLNKYLTDHRFGTGEFHQLRLAFESVTGQDLNWFFNQWYFAKGHPVLDISYEYDWQSKTVTVSISQVQDTYDGTPYFRIPLEIDVYANGNVKRYSSLMDEANESFSFSCEGRPDLVNVDAEKILICEKSDHKSDTAFAFQLNHGPLYLDRLESLQFFAENPASPFYQQAMLRGLNDKSFGIREFTLEQIQLQDMEDQGGLLKEKIISLARTDSGSMVRALAIDEIGTWNDTSIIDILELAMLDSSYLVISTALQSLSMLDSSRAYVLAQVLEKDSADEVVSGLCAVYARLAGPEKNDFFLKQLQGSDISYNIVVSYGQYLSRWPEEKEEIGKALPTLYDIAAHDSKWYVRLAATNSLEHVYSALDARKEQYIAMLLSEGVSSDDKQEWYTRINAINIQMEELETKVGAIKAAETNENLKMMYGVD